MLYKITIESEDIEGLEEKFKNYLEGQKALSFLWDFETEVLRHFRKYGENEFIDLCKEAVSEKFELESDADKELFDKAIFSALSVISEKYYDFKVKRGLDLV